MQIIVNDLLMILGTGWALVLALKVLDNRIEL
jgi:hypothetical protein